MFEWVRYICILSLGFCQSQIIQEKSIEDQIKQESSKFESSIKMISIVLIILTLLISFLLIKKHKHQKPSIKNHLKTTIKLNQQTQNINNLHQRKSNLLQIKQTLTFLYTVYKNLLYIKTKMYNQSNLLSILTILQTQQSQQQQVLKMENQSHKKVQQTTSLNKNNNNDDNNDRKQNLINMKGQEKVKKINQQSIIGVQDNNSSSLQQTKISTRFEDEVLKRLQKMIYINTNQLCQQASSFINQLKQSKIILNPKYFNIKNNPNDISQSSSNPTLLSDLIKYNIYIKHYIINIQQKLLSIKLSSTEQNQKQLNFINHKSNIQLIKSSTLLINDIIELLNVIQQIIFNQKKDDRQQNKNINKNVNQYGKIDNYNNNKKQQQPSSSNKIKNNKIMFSQLKQTINTIFNNIILSGQNNQIQNSKRQIKQSILQKQIYNNQQNLMSNHQQNLIKIYQLIRQLSLEVNLNNNDSYHQQNQNHYQKEKQLINCLLKQYIYQILKQQQSLLLLKSTSSLLGQQQTVKPQMQNLHKNYKSPYQQKSINNYHHKNQHIEKKIQCIQKMIQHYQSNLIKLKQKHNKVTQKVQKYQIQSDCYYNNKNQSNSTYSIFNHKNDINIGTQIKIYQDQQITSNQQSSQVNNTTTNNQKPSSQTNQIFSQKNKIKFIKQLDKLMIRNRIKKQQEFIQHKMKLQQQLLLVNQE